MKKHQEKTLLEQMNREFRMYHLTFNIAVYF
jgi:hypothetical protein